MVLLGKWYFLQGGILRPDWINTLHCLMLSGNTHGAVPSPLCKAFTTLRGLYKLQAARKILEECLKKEKEKRGRKEQKQTGKKTSEGIWGLMGMRCHWDVGDLTFPHYMEDFLIS